MTTVAINEQDGSTPAEDLVAVQVDCERFGGLRTVTIGGRLVLEKRFRDRAPRLGNDVILVSGHLTAKSGSMKHPTIGSNTAVIEVRGIPRAVAARWGTIIKSGVDTAALLDERSRLVARIATLDALLAAR